MISVLIHVEYQQRVTHRHIVQVIPSPVVVKLARVRVVREDHPAGTTAKCVRRLLEFVFPTFVTAESLFNHVKRFAAWLRIAAHVGEVQLVQND